VEERDALALDELGVVGVVRHDHDDVRVQVAGAVLPQQLEQRVLGT
jgi:hypothetical protein